MTGRQVRQQRLAATEALGLISARRKKSKDEILNALIVIDYEYGSFIH
jgi:hypothetical protein